MPRKDWDKDLARSLYDSGATDREIALKCDVTLSTVSRWRRSLNLSSHQARSRMDPAKALELYNEGLLDTEIAAEIGVSPSAIGIWRREQGLAPNKRWDKKKALLLYNEGYSDDEIAEEVGSTAKAIWAWRNQIGATEHEPSEEDMELTDALEPMDEESSPEDMELTDALEPMDEEPSQEDMELTDALEPMDDELTDEDMEPMEDELTDVLQPMDDQEDEDEDAMPHLTDILEDLIDADGADDDDLGSEPYPNERRRRPTVLEAALEVFWRQGYMIGELAEALALDTDLVHTWVTDNHPTELDRLDFDTALAHSMLNQGKTDKEIAAAFGIAARNVTEWRRRHDLAVETPSFFDEEKATQLFKRGMFDRDIARELGGDVTKADVQAWRSRNNLNLYMDGVRSAPPDKSRSDRYSSDRYSSDRSNNRRNSYGNRSAGEGRYYTNNRQPVDGRQPATRGSSTYQKNYNQPRQYTGTRPNNDGNRQGRTYGSDDSHRAAGTVQPRQGYRKRNWDVVEARRLWEQGLSDVEIAQQLGTSAGAIKAWRQQSNLRRPRD